MATAVVCRLCGCTKNVNDMIGEISDVEDDNLNKIVTLKDNISFYCRVEFNGDPNLPQSVCRLCRLQFEVFTTFIANLKEVEKSFRSETSLDDTPMVKNEMERVKVEVAEPLGIKFDQQQVSVKNLLDIFWDHLNKSFAELETFSHITVDLENVEESGEVSQIWLKQYTILTWKDLKYQCQHCDMEITSLFALLNHFKDQKIPKTKIKCAHCTLTFASLNAYINHAVRNHGFEHLPFSCIVCGKIFYNVAALINHFSRDHKKIPVVYPCIECGFYAQSNSSLLIHVMTHKRQEISDDEVEESPKGSTDKPKTETKTSFHPNVRSSLEILSSTSKRRSYPCDKCPRVNVSKQGAQYHKLIHSGSKPFSCGKCQKEFRSKQNLDSHSASCF